MTTITIKRSSTASAIPATGDLAVGELAVNLEDKRLFTKQSDGTVIELSTNPTDLDAATLRIDGVEITASATELNSLDGFTGSTAELNLLDGLTATTIELNTLDGITASTAELNKLDGYTGSTAELNILDGVTATTAELNFVDGVTSNIQTQLNNKQPLDAQLTDVAGLTPADGSFIVGNGTNFVAESGDTAIASLGVTATAAELNTLDGITSTTAELNTLDGITATTTELNYTDGVTSNIQTQLDGKATTAQGALADSAVQPNDNVSFGTGSFSGEISANGGIALGDNDKATFGTGDDLQIYHDGSHSYIDEQGTGRLYINSGNGVWFANSDGSEISAKLNVDSACEFRYDNAIKLATTSTGVDVTGTVTADGLTIDGVETIDNPRSNTAGEGFLIVENSTGTATKWAHRFNTARNYIFDHLTSAGWRTYFTIGSNGDIEFFEDTGTTAKMVWDASAESLGIGTDSPSALLHMSGASAQLRIEATSGNSQINFADSADSNIGILAYDHSSNAMTFRTNDAERARIDSSGSLLVGTTNTTLYDASAGTTADRGFLYRADLGLTTCSRNNGNPLALNRTDTDGDIALFRKDGSTVGSIGSVSGTDLDIKGGAGIIYIGGNQGGGLRAINSSGSGQPRLDTRDDATTNLGATTNRFKDLYLSGGVHLGGTGSANKLDDYETGNWTPQIIIGSTGYSPTTTNSAKYVKVGNLVHCYVNADFSGLPSGSGTLIYFGGLPFSANALIPCNVSISETYSATNLFVASAAQTITGGSMETNNRILFSDGSYAYVRSEALNTSGRLMLSVTYHTLS